MDFDINFNSLDPASCQSGLSTLAPNLSQSLAGL